MASSAPGAWSDPPSIEQGEWLPAIVPGTVASSLRVLGRWRPEDGVAFDAFDFWYRAEIVGDGAARLRFDGLATLAEVYLDDALVLASDNMFVANEIAVVLGGRHRLHIAFRSLDAHLAGRKGRARWRPKLVQPPTLRFVRTLLLGHIPGWGPPVHAIGPYRPIQLLDADMPRIIERHVATHVDRHGDGLIDVAVTLSSCVEGWVTARCGDVDFVLVDEGDGILRGRAEIPRVELWWPHTHGAPALHRLTLYVGDRSLELGKVGFRTIAVDRDTDGKGFGLSVNGEPLFCRGACWTTPDLVALPFSREAYLPLLTLACDAGMNMIRVGGTMGYEGDAFYTLCDELGLLVWQDFAFANFDYSAGDTAFLASVDLEARQFLSRTQVSPCLAVLCGGSEVAQQAAMLGMPPRMWSNQIFDEILPAATAALRPDVPYVPNSPWVGDLPFVAHEGISHYYGVSAHLRAVEEARRANVRFTAESLGFANVPDVAPFELLPGAPEIVHRSSVDRLPYETSASWAFEAVRNHYTTQLYGIDVAALRQEDPERFLAFARATSAEVMEATYGEWRRAGSSTQGALVWFLRDLFDGAGWGVIDARGAPKAAYFGLKRAFRPITVVLTDENLNGLLATVINETALACNVKLVLTCLREGATIVMQGETTLTLAPRSKISLPPTAIWGGFFDTTYAYRFGPPSHDVTVASLFDTTTSDIIAESFHFPLGRGCERSQLDLTAHVVSLPGKRFDVRIATRRFAQSVRISVDGFRPAENYFHLAPGAPRLVRLEAVLHSSGSPVGAINALNGSGPVRF